MTSSEASRVSVSAFPEESPQTVSSRLPVLRKRSDFTRASRAAHIATPGFVLQMRKRSPDEMPGEIRVGFTCSKKVGNAVARNRAKRRLRAIAQMILPSAGLEGMDYVLIGRKGATASLPFTALQEHLHQALNSVHARVK